MKKFQLNAEPRTELGKKAVKAIRKEGKIPAVINGGELVELPYNGTLKAGQKLVEIDAKRGIITTDIVVKAEDVRKLVYTPDIFEVDINLNGEERRQAHPLHFSAVAASPDKNLRNSSILPSVHYIFTHIPFYLHLS